MATKEEQLDHQILHVKHAIIRSYTDTSEATFNVCSPEETSPNLESVKIVRYSASRVVIRKPREAPFSAITFILVAVSLDMLLRIPGLTQLHGGYYFIIPLFTCLILVAAPIACLEVALGQITTQLSSQIFSTMAPIFAGLGYLMEISRLINSFVFSDAKYPMLLVGMMKQLLPSYTDTSCYKSGYYCFNPDSCSSFSDQSHHKALSNATVFFANKCVTARNQSRSDDYHLLKYRLISTLAPMADMGSILGMRVDALSSVIVYSCFVFIVARNGILSFSKCSIWIIMILLSSFIALGLINLHDYNVSKLQSLLFMQSDPTALLSPEIWATALSSAISLLRVGDGTMHFIGMHAGFKNNVLKTYFSIIIYCTILLPTSFIVVLLVNNNVDREFPVNDLFQWSLPNQISVPQYNQPLTIVQHLVMIILVCVLMMSQLPYHLITFEIVNYRLTMLASPHAQISTDVQKVISSVLYGMLLTAGYGCLSMFLILDDVHFMVWSMFCPIVLVEMMILILYYGIDRLFVNLKTMLKDASLRLSQWPAHMLKVYLRFVIPTCFLICILSSDFVSVFNTLCAASVSYTVLLFIIAAPMINVMTRHVLFGRAIEPTLRNYGRWGPLNIHARREMEYGQRAARIYT